LTVRDTATDATFAFYSTGSTKSSGSLTRSATIASSTYELTFALDLDLTLCYGEHIPQMDAMEMHYLQCTSFEHAIPPGASKVRDHSSTS